MMASPIVFFDIAGPDDVALRNFYAAVFGWQADPFGQVRVDATTPLPGMFRKRPPDTLIFLGVPDVSASLAEVDARGGKIEAPRAEVPGVMALGLFRDPAGNAMGLIERPIAGSPIVFLEIAGPDDLALRDFYAGTFGWPVEPSGQVRVEATTPLGGAFRKDPVDKRIYIGVPDVTATLAEVQARGGTVDAPRFEVPGVVVLGLFRDPAGNTMGLVEMEGDRPKIP
ncbi:Glyoxalase-like domain protein [Aquisphaera giovannonii]|uniref:Glyoxalase-like domain protein n=1 Tax=Aquisphaera giovannonii TaxID=406548 RepID=A0A5B9VVN5_9BACT|nr:VOC family protein [Aquisphaera giovannonii]QEH32506.1 Glyoxalase-like domain protein [Aquisphaera giovannonii]